MSSHIPCFMHGLILEMRCSQITEHRCSRASGGKKTEVAFRPWWVAEGINWFRWLGKQRAGFTARAIPSHTTCPQAATTFNHMSRLPQHFKRSPLSCPARLQRLISLLQDKCSLCSYHHCIKRPIRSLSLSQGRRKIFPNMYFPVLCPG